MKKGAKRGVPLLSATLWLIILNVFFFIFFSILFFFVPSSKSLIFLQAQGVIDSGQWWTLLTSMFMHGGIFHLLVNMFSLFFIGSFCEQLIGRKRFLGIYFLSGILAGLIFIAGAYAGSNISWGHQVLGGIDTYAVGASGALFGILGILAVLIPRYRVYLITGPIILFIILAMLDAFPSSLPLLIISSILNILLIVMVFSLFLPLKSLQKISLPLALPMWVAPIVAIVPLVLLSYTIELPIGNSAHLGGLIVGLIYGVFLRLKYPQKMLLLKRFFK